MLDAVEAGISALRSWHMPEESPGPGTVEAVAILRAELQGAGISAAEFARGACVAQREVEAWLADISPVPHWVPAAIRLMALLTPSARHKLFYAPAGTQVRPANCHPFSRIEEL
jgi:hypothetical protein